MSRVSRRIDGVKAVESAAVGTWREWCSAALTLGLLVGAATGVPAAQHIDARCEANCVARALIEKIPSGQRIALIPFGPRRTAIPAETADALYDDMVRSMFEASKGRHTIKRRDRTNEVWESWQTERNVPGYEDMWKERQVDVTVHCYDVGLQEDGLEVSCTAYPIGKENILKTDVSGPLGACRT